MAESENLVLELVLQKNLHVKVQLNKFLETLSSSLSKILSSCPNHNVLEDKASLLVLS